MSARRPSGLRTCAFGDLDAGLWGFAGATDGSDGAQLAGGHLGIRDDLSRQMDALRIEGSGTEGDWHLRATGLELSVSPGAESAALEIPDHDVDGFSQLCRIHGTLVTDEGELELECLGQRGARSGPDPMRIGSSREVLAWFGPDDGLTLVSMRPRRADGHDRDAITCVLFEGGQPVEVAEPRLSSTYTAAGTPSRASLELWLEERQAEGNDTGQPEAALFPRRVAGEAVGPTAQLALAGLDVRAELFRWHMNGREGAGLYILSRPS